MWLQEGRPAERQVIVPDLFQEVLAEGLRKGYSLAGYEQNRLYLQTGSGAFAEAGWVLGVAAVEDSRGCAVFDYDRDGDLDLVVRTVNRDNPIRFYENQLPRQGSFLSLRLVSRSGGRGTGDAIGARVCLWTDGSPQRRVVEAGSGFLSQHSAEVHFGLGNARGTERIEVLWPDGHKQQFGSVAADHFYEVRQGDKSIRRRF